VDEAGAPGLHMSVWYGLWAPAATPKPILAKLTAAAQEAMADPVVRQHLTELGMEIPPPDQQTPQALAARQKADIDQWWPVIKAAGLRAQ
jgi:tripartite-type tricarboxylate transporter receptor subunit TctC